MLIRPPSNKPLHRTGNSLVQFDWQSSLAAYWVDFGGTRRRCCRPVNADPLGGGRELRRRSKAHPVSTLTAALLLVFAPKRLVAASVEAAVAVSPPSEGEEHERRRRDELRLAFSSSINEVRRSLSISGVLVLLSLTLAGSLAFSLRANGLHASVSTISALQYWGAGVLLWATLGRGGWPIQTLKGDTPHERADLLIFKALYVFGTFLLALSVTW